MHHSLDKLLETAKNASLEAGAAILDIYNSNNWRVTAKADDSPLTAADQAAHKLIQTKLAPTRLPVLSEEGRQPPFEERKQWEFFWMVDPLDGTKEFIKKNGEFTVNIALIHWQKAIAGVVYAPVLDIMYWGSQEEGAWKAQQGSQQQIHVRADARVKTIVASRSHLSPETESFIIKYPGAEIISMGSSLKFMLVAEGKAQVYPRFAPTMEWDTAAAQAILEAAGGKMLQIPDGSPFRYNKEDLLNPWFVAWGS